MKPDAIDPTAGDLAQAPTHPRSVTLLRHLHSDSYDRLTANPPEIHAPPRPPDHAPHATTPHSPRFDDHERSR